MTVDKDYALRLHEAGFGVVPPKEDGTKRPVGTWRQYEHQAPDRATVERWYANPRDGIGIVCGASSGHVEMLELEGVAVHEGMLDVLYQRAAEKGLGDLLADIGQAYMEETPSGGVHWYYRVESGATGNVKLARREKGLNALGLMEWETLIETRGQGGYSVIAPSGGKVHPKAGSHWSIICGDILDIVTITADQRDQLHNLCRTFDELPEVAPTPAPRVERPLSAASTSSGWFDQTVANYNQRTTWEEELVGWTYHHRHGDIDYWTRPGKDPREGHSASTNANGTDRFIAFTSTIHPGVEPWSGNGPATSYDRFSYYAVMHHNGDRTEAAKCLRDEGYGPPPEPSYEEVAPTALLAETPSDGGSDLPPMSDADGWPILPDAAMHGPCGDYVRAAAPHTEADPAAILAQLLTGVGCIANKGPHAIAGNEPHPASLFLAVVGQTSKGKKGTSWAAARIVLDRIDPDFTGTRILGGFGSGEILIETMGAGPDAIGDDGPATPKDVRTLVFEGELASILNVAGREKSTLGQTIRNGWDGKTLAARTRGKGSVVVTDYHLAVVGHITLEELRSTLSDKDTYGGTTNRFLWVAARRARLLPDGGNIPDELAEVAARTLDANITRARRHTLYKRTPAAAALWRELYTKMAEDVPPGLLGAAVARAEAQVLRLSLTYAIADGAEAIDLVHLEAAWAFWQYCRATAAYIFPASTVVAETLLAAITAAGERGLNRTVMHAVSGGHIERDTLNAAVQELIDRGLVVEERLPAGPKGGRPSTVAMLAKYAGSHDA